MGKLITRRRFLIGTAVVGGGLAVGYALKEDPPANEALSATAKDGEFALNAYVKIDQSGQVTIAIPHSEMGQGVMTSLSMLVAEELEIDVSDVKPVHAPVSPVYANFTAFMDSLPFSDGHHNGEATAGAWGMKNLGHLMGLQATGGSTSVRNSWEPMQYAGATAREMLISAAAIQWGVDASECKASKGRVLHEKSGKSAGYGDLVEAASIQEIQNEIPLKSANQRSTIGKSQPRLDIPSKVNGTATFGVDVELPGMMYAAVKLSPVFGGTVASMNEKAIADMPGVKKAVSLGTGVAVIADSFWRAKQAAEALPVTFDEGEAATVSSESIFKQYEEALKSDEGRSYAEEGDVQLKFADAGNLINARYKAPFLAHACMEPMNCTALYQNNGIEVWSPNQSPTLSAWFAEKAADVPAENVTVHTTLLGGGFGRRIEIDYLVMAVQAAKAVPGTPVKLIWTRENDIQHDMYRPAAMGDFSASLGTDGKISAFHSRLASPSITRNFVERLLPWAGADTPDNTTAEGVADLPYAFKNKLIEHIPSPTPIPVGYWRSVGHSYTGFFTECFMDELAGAAKKDPVEFRLTHLKEHKDFTDVLLKLKKLSNWNSPLPKGSGRGLALHESFGSIVGQVVELSVSEDKSVKLDKIYCVIDCGTVVNPDTVVAQMESGIIYGLTAAAFGEISIENGRVQQSNFPDYEMLTMAMTPEIIVELAPSGRPMGGVGEPGTPPIAPALANAIFNATGERIRELPIRKSGFEVTA